MGGNRIANVLYDFEASMADEMGVREGQRLMVRPCEGDEWLMAVVLDAADMQVGMVPATFVQDSAVTSGDACVAIYAYSARDENELSVEEGEELTCISKLGEEWACCSTATGKIGLIPLNYLSFDAPTSVEIQEEEEAKEEIGEEADSIPAAPPMPARPAADSPEEADEFEDAQSEHHSSGLNSPEVDGKPVDDMIEESKRRLQDLQHFQQQRSSPSASTASVNWVKPSTASQAPQNQAAPVASTKLPMPKVSMPISTTIKAPQGPPKPVEVVKSSPVPETSHFQLPPVNLRKADPTAKPSGTVNYQPNRTTSKGPQVTEVNGHGAGRAEQAVVVRASPKPANELRQWTDASGSFKIEATYEGMGADGSVTLLKSNGAKVSVQVDKLCSRDVDYVYGKEGLPVPTELRRRQQEEEEEERLAAGGFDWLKFLLDAGIVPERARKYAQTLGRERVGEADAADVLTRDWMRRRDFDSVDAIAIEGHVQRLASTRRGRGSEVEDRMLEALDQLSLRVDSLAQKKGKKQSSALVVRSKERLHDYEEDDSDNTDEEEEEKRYKQRQQQRRKSSTKSSKGSSSGSRTVVRERVVYESNKMHPGQLLDIVSPTTQTRSQPQAQPNYQQPQQYYAPPPQPQMMAMYAPPPPPPPPQMIAMPVMMQAPPPPPPPPQIVMMTTTQAPQYAPPQPAYYGYPPQQPQQQGYYYR